MSLFQQQKNKRFHYTSRQHELEGGENDGQLESKWQDSKRLSKSKGKSPSTFAILAVILGMIIVLWFVLDHFKN